MIGRLQTLAAVVVVVLLSPCPVPTRGEGPGSGAELFPSRLDFGPVRVGSIVEAGAHVTLEIMDETSELAAKVVPPPFLKVKSLRVREREIRGKPARLVELGLSLDTSREGEFNGKVGVELGGQHVERSVAARVLPKVAGLTKVLVICPSFGEASGDPGYYRPWFKLVEDARLDVSYIDPSREGLAVQTHRRDEHDMPVLPDWIKAFDVILLIDGGPVYIQGFHALALRSYVKGGGRLVVGASAFMAGSVPNANQVLEPFGLRMDESEAFADQRGPRTRGDAKPLLLHRGAERDPLTAGVKDVAFSRVSTVEVTDQTRARLLISDGHYPGKGYAAVARDGGEVIAIGPGLLFSWLGGEDDANDNVVLMRNLLTRPRTGRAAAASEKSR